MFWWKRWGEKTPAPRDLTLGVPNPDSLDLKAHDFLPPSPLSIQPQLTPITYKDGQQNQVPGEVPPVRQGTGLGRGSLLLSSTLLETSSFSHPSTCHLSVNFPHTLEVRSEGGKGRLPDRNPERDGTLSEVHSTLVLGRAGSGMSKSCSYFNKLILNPLTYLGPEQQARVR